MKIKAPGFRVGPAYSLAFSPDGECVAAVGRSVVLWSVSRRERLRSISMLKDPSTVAFSPTGTRVAIQNTVGEILLCDTATADPIARYVPEGVDEGPGPLFYRSDLMIDASWSGEIRERSTTDLTPRVLWSAPHVMVEDVMCSADGHQWAFTVSSKQVDSQRGSSADFVLFSDDPEASGFVKLQPTWQVLRSTAISSSGEHLAVRSGAKEHFVQIVEVRTSKKTSMAEVSQGGTGWRMCWSPESTYLVLVERSGFSFRTAHDLQEVAWLPSEYPADVTFSPAGNLIALGGWKNGIVAPWPAVLEELQPRPGGGSGDSPA